LFIRKILRSKNTDLNTDFIENLGNFFETGSVIFLLEFFVELMSLKGENDALQNFLKAVNIPGENMKIISFIRLLISL